MRKSANAITPSVDPILAVLLAKTISLAMLYHVVLEVPLIAAHPLSLSPVYSPGIPLSIQTPIEVDRKLMNLGAFSHGEKVQQRNNPAEVFGKFCNSKRIVTCICS